MTYFSPSLEVDMVLYEENKGRRGTFSEPDQVVLTSVSNKSDVNIVNGRLTCRSRLVLQCITTRVIELNSSTFLSCVDHVTFVRGLIAPVVLPQSFDALQFH